MADKIPVASRETVKEGDLVLFIDDRSQHLVIGAVQAVNLLNVSTRVNHSKRTVLYEEGVFLSKRGDGTG